MAAGPQPAAAVWGWVVMPPPPPRASPRTALGHPSASGRAVVTEQ